jgi:hypothetical protein
MEYPLTISIPRWSPSYMVAFFFCKNRKMAFVSLKKIGNKILGAEIVELYHYEKIKNSLHSRLHKK